LWFQKKTPENLFGTILNKNNDKNRKRIKKIKTRALSKATQKKLYLFLEKKTRLVLHSGVKKPALFLFIIHFFKINEKYDVWLIDKSWNSFGTFPPLCSKLFQLDYENYCSYTPLFSTQIVVNFSVPFCDIWEKILANSPLKRKDKSKKNKTKNPYNLIWFF